MNAQANLTIFDFALLPFYLAIIYAIAYKFRDKHYPPGHAWRPYFISGLTVKVVGAIFISLVYGYYYGGGDTYYYFNHAQVINSAMDESVGKWFNLLFHIPSMYDPGYYEYISQMEWYADPPTYTVCSVAAVFSILTFNTFLATSVLFALVSFTGVWALFRTFANIYPHLIRQIGFAVLFIPSVFVWGSGVFKDTLCLLGLGWLVYSVFRFLVQKDFTFKNIFIAILSFSLILSVKVYIILAFAPGLFLWIFFNYSKGIQNSSLKALINFLFVVIITVGSLFFMTQFSASLGKYSLENVAETSTITRTYIFSISGDEGSSYDLGDFEPTLAGMLSKFPPAINVTLFRPYPWEAKKVIVLLSALEAIIFIFLTLKTIFVVGFVRIWRAIKSDPTIQFCLIFTVIFAFAVGISSYNFGTLSRYKIPCLPFYIISIVLIYYKNVPPGKKLIRFLGI